MGDDLLANGTTHQATPGQALWEESGLGYLLVIEPASSRVVQLPASGSLVVGRSEEAELPVDDRLVSRAHARIAMRNGSAAIIDLESHNGTFLNGERVLGEAPLLSGDVITLGESRLLYHASTRADAYARELDVPRLRARLAEEVRRARFFRRSVSVLVIALKQHILDRALIVDALAQELRPVDQLCWVSAGQLAILLPELTRAEAEQFAEKLLDVVNGRAPDAHIGVAACPADTTDVDELLASAREASGSADRVRVSAAPASHRTLEIGGQAVVIADTAMIHLYGLLERLAKADFPVLVIGETGAGKEIVANTIHTWSSRRSGPFVAVNCAAIAEELAESELFGHVRGAFTGATGNRPGLFESAHGGTLFLDEIGELSASLQAKLLRALETKTVTRVGETTPRQVDVRIVAATHRDLRHAVEQSKFRKDLFFRLNAATVWVPPLRHRPRELRLLFRAFLTQACVRMGMVVPRIADDALAEVTAYSWPGNVRELKNAAEYLAVVQSGEIAASTVRHYLRAGTQTEETSTLVVERKASKVESSGFRSIDDEIRELERSRMLEALEQCDGNQTRAASMIGMPLRTFVTKVKSYGLSATRKA